MEKKLNALVVDDEDSARKLLKKLLEETLFFNEIRVVQSVNNANIELTNFEPDIIFLDIKMPGKDGFSLINDIKENCKDIAIVFVSAYEQYAIKALRNHAFDYLLKPVNRKDLKQCIARYIDNKNEAGKKEIYKNGIVQKDNISRIRVNTRTGTLFINPSTILYCKADGNYTTICTGNKLHLCSMNIGRVVDMLPVKGFIRVGRSHVINFEYVSLLDRKESSVTLVRDGESVTIKLPRKHLKDLDIL
jgi:two-component system, LytTR family, response regulator